MFYFNRFISVVNVVRLLREKKCSKCSHVCGLDLCLSCKKFVRHNDHRCFFNKIPPQPANSKLLFFDFETDQSTGWHLVNFAVAQKEDGMEKVFYGYTACEQFCSDLFSAEHKGYTAVAHNMLGFDGQFVLGWLLLQGLKPIDSYNFLPMPLIKLPNTFGMEELAKSFFSHLFNERKNQDYRGPVPDASFFSPYTMSTSMREKFHEWYEERKKPHLISKRNANVL